MNLRAVLLAGSAAGTRHPLELADPQSLVIPLPDYAALSAQRPAPIPPKPTTNITSPRFRTGANWP